MPRCTKRCTPQAQRKSFCAPPGLGINNHARLPPVNLHVGSGERERESCEAHLLALHHLELHIRTPGHRFTEGLVGFRSAMGKTDDDSSKTASLVWRVLRQRFSQNLNRFAHIQKKQTLNTYTVWVVARNEARTW